MNETVPCSTTDGATRVIGHVTLHQYAEEEEFAEAHVQTIARCSMYTTQAIYASSSVTHHLF